MALIQCPECQGKISDKANICPKCGFPIKDKTNNEPSLIGMNICPKCGKFIIGKENCPDCGTQMVSCHCSEEDWTTIMLEGSLEKWEHQMRVKYVVNSSLFDVNLYNARLRSEKKEDDYYNDMIEKAPESSPTIKCPYCSSTNTKKITNTSKAVHTAFFGIFSIGRNSKQWHCNSCGSDF